MSSESVDESKRLALWTGVTAALALGVSACAGSDIRPASASASPKKKKEEEEEETEVSPAEDLMQEHGIVHRVLLVFDEAAMTLTAGKSVDLSAIVAATRVVKEFVEGYHEKQEEEYVFPRLEKANKEVALVATLRQQHERGRALTAAIERSAQASTRDSAELIAHLTAYTRMYRAHASREDTVAFREFRNLYDNDDYRELGELFEKREHAILGEKGYERALASIYKVEEALGIHDLASYTPKIA